MEITLAVAKIGGSIQPSDHREFDRVHHHRAIAGWIAGKVAKDSGSNLLLNIVIGIVGALVGAFLLIFIVDTPAGGC